MANSKYGYVKSFEKEHYLKRMTWIVVTIEHNDLHNFADIHEFEKPNEKDALKLTNSCAVATLEEFPDISFAYGFSDEYSFVFKKKSEFYNRRLSKIISISASYFMSTFAFKWNDFFPRKQLKYAPSFDVRVACYSTMGILLDYLASRQVHCHVNNQYNTCFWNLVQSGLSEMDAQNILKGTQSEEKNELLFTRFGINYNSLPAIFRKGSCVYIEKVEETVKYSSTGDPVRRFRSRVVVDHCDIIGPEFWHQHPSILASAKEVAKLTKQSSPRRLQWEPDSDSCKKAPPFFPSSRSVVETDQDSGTKLSLMEKNDFGSVKKWLEEECKSVETEEDPLMPMTWIVVRIDGRHFHKFADAHEFEKPNDEDVLKLMNSCAVAMLEEIQDITFAYGVSDEYSFVFKKTSEFCGRIARKIILSSVLCFTYNYVMKWKNFFPRKPLKYPPSFDGRVVCYPTVEILGDYLAWRQVDCHVNNQYNTCFWNLVHSGLSKRDAQNFLKGTVSVEKNELLFTRFGINYESLPAIFRKGSSVYREEVEETAAYSSIGDPLPKLRSKVIVDHCDIIGPEFWNHHPSILAE